MKRRILNVLVVVSVILRILWVWLSHEFHTPDYILAGRAGMKVCPKHLETIGVGLKRYAADHGGNLPQDLETFRKEGYASEQWELVCPNSNDNIGSGCSYEMVAGGQRLSQLAPSDIVVREREFNHDIEPFSSQQQCRFLLRADGSVVQEFRAYVAPRPTTSQSQP